MDIRYYARTLRFLDVVLFVSTAVQILLFFYHVTVYRHEVAHSPIWEILYPLSFCLLVTALVVRRIIQARTARVTETRRRHLDNMISMFSNIKHLLNNDMQVVLGNAELASIVIESSGDAKKAVSNISLAANDAIEHIEQLSAFSAIGQVSFKAIDLNSAIRECMAKLAAEAPPLVNITLDLERLSTTRVVADRYLLGLSLTHLVKQAIKSMRHGGEIIVRTSEQKTALTGSRSVNTEIFIVRALSHTGSDNSDLPHARRSAVVDSYNLDKDLSTAKALMQRSGAEIVGLKCAAGESRITMTFSSEPRRNWHNEPLQLDGKYG
ncbi:MAG: hypothetical protein KTR32_07435 [Granulosicoccus sp.]|nr:hypothetical protein [Granulosicoccus sp.]